MRTSNARNTNSPRNEIEEEILLELIIKQNRKRGGVAPRDLAKTLLNRFGSYPAIVCADPDHFKDIDGIDEATVATLKAIEIGTKYFARSSLLRRKKLITLKSIITYLKIVMAHNEREEVRVLYLDKHGGVIADELHATGTVDGVSVYTREIMRRALQLGATALILAHNHPSGCPEPSRTDITMTKRIIEAAQPLDILVQDHIIISRQGYTSMKSLKLI